MNEIYKKVLQYLEQGKPIMLETTITGTEGARKDGLTKRIAELAEKSDTGADCCVKAEGESLWGRTVYREPIFPTERLLVLGAGHIAVPVCEFAAKLGFSVTVCDDRPEFANSQRFPAATAVICDSFPNGIASMSITAYDYAVVITRGHRHDADCLRSILSGTHPTYLGMIGSRRRVRGLLDMLCEEGYDRAVLDRIRTPIGLDIGAVTPAEIALSIVAEIVACKRKQEYFGSRDRYTDSDLEPELIRYLAASEEPRTVVTVLETKGSTPRGAGAKMAVNSVGQTVGSIGGGCSEKAIIRDAVRMIGTGTYRVVDIDLTGDVAESAGMVCGGTMRVLIEDETDGSKIC